MTLRLYIPPVDTIRHKGRISDTKIDYKTGRKTIRH